MKTAFVALLLVAAVAFMVMGCSDDSTQPVSPTDQSIQAPGPLQKNIIREFLGEEGPDPDGPGLVLSPMRIVDDGMTFQSLRENTYFHADFLDGGPDLVSGKGVLELNYKFDPNTFEGFTWGKLVLKPDALVGADGVWEISWQGKMWVDLTGQTIAPLKWVGHGKGGAVNGMQLFGDDTIYMTDFAHWIGKGGKNCYVKEH